MWHFWHIVLSFSTCVGACNNHPTTTVTEPSHHPPDSAHPTLLLWSHMLPPPYSLEPIDHYSFAFWEYHINGIIRNITFWDCLLSLSMAPLRFIRVVMCFIRASHAALVVKNLPANAGDLRDTGSIPRWWKIPWRRKWQPTPVFLPGESHGERSLAGYSP